MHRLFYFLAVIAFATLGAEESKEKPNPILSLDRLYGKPEFSAKSYGVKWLEAGQGYVRLEKSKATKFRLLSGLCLRKAKPIASLGRYFV